MSNNKDDIHEKSKELTMYIFVNSSLKMSKGKTAAQVGHLTQLITQEIVTKSFTYRGNHPPDEVIRFNKWSKEGAKKIVLKADAEQMQEIIKMSEARYIIDQGRTQIPANSLTVAGFFPSTENYDYCQKFKLLG